MSLLSDVWALCQKEAQLEWRQKHGLNGLLLYIGSTIFVVYMAFMEVEPITWMTVWWIILLFASANAVAKSFLQESDGRQLYHYLLVSPQAIILSKMLYNALLLLLIAAIGLGVYSVLLGNPVRKLPIFLVGVALGAISFSTTFSMASAIAFKAGKGSTLMPILSFPIIIPLIVLLVRVSAASLMVMEDVNLNQNISVLLAINVLIVALALILFPYLWKE